jgi:hypothetical protein
MCCVVLCCVLISYESLRWAVLSTKLTISNMSHIIYRSLLKPLNEASMHALTMSLIGSLEVTTPFASSHDPMLHVSLVRTGSGKVGMCEMTGRRC